MNIYLYIKTHNKTGFKYLGKTTKDPMVYKGSGKDWRKHLKLYSNDVSTEILKVCSSNTELNYWGRYYSTLFKITTAVDNYGNRIWANRIPESGGGGEAWNKGLTKHTSPRVAIVAEKRKAHGNPHQFGKKHSQECVEKRRQRLLNRKMEPHQVEKMSVAKKGKSWEEIFGLEEAIRRRKEMQSRTGEKHPKSKKVNTPSGVFTTVSQAATHHGVCGDTVRNRCLSKSTKHTQWFYITRTDT
jgi:hypothetical protein